MLYRFKHALIQDAAYESLLQSRRQALHRRAGEILRDQPDRATAEPEVIVFHHFRPARRPASTISPSNGGARRATRRSAAKFRLRGGDRAHLGKAIAMADKEEEGIRAHR